MKAAIVETPGTFTLRDLPDPACPDDGVVIRVRATTICPSDLKRSQKLDLPQPPPFVLGHELAGTIAAVGKNVKGWRIGERVGVAPRIYCGRCAPCRAGHTNLCRHNTALIRFRGRICIHASLPADESALSVDANKVHYEEWTITGSSSFKQRQYVESLDLIRHRVINPDTMIGSHLPLAEIARGVDQINRRVVLKVALGP